MSSIDLANQHLADDQALVLCAVDASTSSLDGSKALQLIQQANKLHNTILVLTKTDLLSGTQTTKQMLYDRILQTSSDTRHLQGLAACVAVANCNHTAFSGMSAAELAEVQTFRNIIQSSQPSCGIRHELLEGLTMQQLAVKVDGVFHAFINKNWAPCALAYLHKKAKEARDPQICCSSSICHLHAIACDCTRHSELSCLRTHPTAKLHVYQLYLFFFFGMPVQAYGQMFCTAVESIAHVNWFAGSEELGAPGPACADPETRWCAQGHLRPGWLLC